MDERLSEERVVRIQSSHIPLPLTANGTHVSLFVCLSAVCLCLCLFLCLCLYLCLRLLLSVPVPVPVPVPVSVSNFSWFVSAAHVGCPQAGKADPHEWGVALAVGGARRTLTGKGRRKSQSLHELYEDDAAPRALGRTGRGVLRV